MFVDILKVIAILCVGYMGGKLISRFKLPSILGWLICGMLFGPHLVGIVNGNILESTWYEVVIKLFECFAGVMIGSEIIFKKLKKYGKKITVITLFQSLGTFLFVSLVFGVVFLFLDIPFYLGFIFGGIALATAPAPALSICNEFKTRGPVTQTLLPIAAIDDVIGIIVFFTVISLVSSFKSEENVSILNIILMVFMPIIIGLLIGWISSAILRRIHHKKLSFLFFISFLFLCTGIGILCDQLIFKEFVLNYLLIGMSFSCTLFNLIPEEKYEPLLNSFQPILSLSFLIVIMNLAMPLDYRLILGAGLFTVVYIISRAIGKIGGAYIGGVATRSEPVIKKYLGLTLLPHSGVSLVFTGIAVSTLQNINPEYGEIVQGTIAAAAIINEIIAVILAKQAFKWAGELNIEKNDRVLNE